VRALLAGDWPSTGGVLNITAVAWTAGFQWWPSGDITRTQNVSDYMLVLALCLLMVAVYIKRIKVEQKLENDEYLKFVAAIPCFLSTSTVHLRCALTV